MERQSFAGGGLIFARCTPPSFFMSEFEQLLALAFHAERVASRRLAAQESIPEEQALKTVLQNAAGEGGLLQLLEIRQAQANANLERVATKRRIKAEKRTSKSGKNLAPEGTWSAWFDGSARPNPGRCGIGVVIKGPNGEFVEISRDVGHGDSSDAEYAAMIVALEMAVQLGATPLVVYGDSQVVIDDVILSAKVPTNLTEHRARAHILLKQLGAVRFRWIPRHKNVDADKLSQLASR
jgi:ribonuclease HI